MKSLSKILAQKFGTSSRLAARELEAEAGIREIRRYYLCVVLGIAKCWWKGRMDSLFFPLCKGESGTENGTKEENLSPVITDKWMEIGFSGEKECRDTSLQFYRRNRDFFEEIPFPEEVEDHFGALYQNLIPVALRKRVGEFYTPDWIADHLVKVAFSEKPVDSRNRDFSVLDPSCGSGVFLLAVARELLRKKWSPQRIWESLCGFDINPLAVITARINLLAGLFSEKISRQRTFPVISAEQENPFSPPISIDLQDSLEDRSENLFLSPDRRFQWILGNPPWINWDRFSPRLHEKIRDLWMDYGLFNLTAKQARGGGAKKELAALMLLRNADQYLCDQGRIAMLVPLSLFQTIHSGSGFRQFRIATTNTPLRVLRVDDFSEIPVFSRVFTKTASVVIEKGERTRYPVPYFKWSTRTESVPGKARPIRETEPESPWRIDFSVLSTAFSEKYSNPLPKKTENEKNREIRASDYRAFLGANTGGANGIYWLEILEDRGKETVLVRNRPDLGKLKVPGVRWEIESALLYPLLRWGDVDRGTIKDPSLCILLPQDVKKRTGIEEQIMHSQYPETFAYLQQFREQLLSRSAYRKYLSGAPFYSMYNVGEQTLAPIKVVWRRMDCKIRAAIVPRFFHPVLGEKPIVPQETTVIIPCNDLCEAEYLVKTLNSPEVDSLIRSFSPMGTKGFGSPGILQYLGIKKYPGE